MKRTIQFLALAALFVGLGGCGLIPVSGSTIAKSPPLSWDVLSMIGAFERQDGVKDTSFPKVKDTTRISTNEKGIIKELWVVDRGGRQINYTVTLMPDGRGGWFFRVEREAQAGEAKP